MVLVGWDLVNRFLDPTAILRYLLDNDREKLAFSKRNIVQVNLDDVMWSLLAFSHPKGEEFLFGWRWRPEEVGELANGDNSAYVRYLYSC